MKTQQTDSSQLAGNSKDRDHCQVDNLLEKISELTAQVEANERDREIQNALFRIADMTTSAENMDAFYKALHDIVRDLISTEAFYIAVYDKNRSAIKFAYYEDDHDDIQKARETPLKNRGFIPVSELEKSLTWRVITANETIRITLSRTALSKTEKPIKGIGKQAQDWLGIPLQKDGEPVGVVAIQSYQQGFQFSDAEVELMTFMAQHIATALQRRQDASDLKLAHAEVQETASELAFANGKLKQEMFEREKINDRLLQLSHQAGKAEVATGVLHNVGNVLNSINVSVNLLQESHRLSRVGSLKKAANLVSEQQDIPAFFAEDERGKAFPNYLVKLSDLFCEEHEKSSAELQRLTEHLNHVKTVVAMQQSYAGVSGLKEAISFPELFGDAEVLISSSLARHGVEVTRDFAELPKLMLEKQQLLQVLVNLLKNAKDSVVGARESSRQVTIRTFQDDDMVIIEVGDNGSGIAPENLTKIFSHGFTTKENGHGFGLHTCGNAIHQMGGTLTATSDGLGLGAVFTIELPFVPVDGDEQI